MKRSTNLFIVPRLRICGGIPSLPPHVFSVQCVVKRPEQFYTVICKIACVGVWQHQHRMASVLAAALYNSPCAICSFIMQIAVDCFVLIDNTSEMSHILESHVTWCRPRRPQFDIIRLWPPPRFFFNTYCRFLLWP